MGRCRDSDGYKRNEEKESLIEVSIRKGTRRVGLERTVETQDQDRSLKTELEVRKR